MGGINKCLLKLSGKPLLSHVLERAQTQVGPIVINANGDPKQYSDFNLPVAEDVVGDFAGPLAGILTALDWASTHAPRCKFVASFPGDSPFFPSDLVSKLYKEIEGGSVMAYASSGDRHHPVFGLWPVASRSDLRDAILANNIRKVDVWTSRHKLGVVNFPTNDIDPFFNLNTKEDLSKAEIYLQTGKIGFSNEHD